MKNLVNQIKLEDIASALEYNYLDGNSCLMIKQNNLTDIRLIENGKRSGKLAQGYIECCSSDTLNSILGSDIDTSEDGMIEASKVYDWMMEQN